MQCKSYTVIKDFVKRVFLTRWAFFWWPGCAFGILTFMWYAIAVFGTFTILQIMRAFREGVLCLIKVNITTENEWSNAVMVVIFVYFALRSGLRGHLSSIFITNFPMVKVPKNKVQVCLFLYTSLGNSINFSEHFVPFHGSTTLRSKQNWPYLDTEDHLIPYKGI